MFSVKDRGQTDRVTTTRPRHTVRLAALARITMETYYYGHQSLLWGRCSRQAYW